MGNLLPELHDSVPLRLPRGNALTHLTLLVVDGVFHHEALAHDSVVKELFLNGQAKFNALGVRLGPQKGGVDEFNLCQTLDSFET
eukprot:CAMPEP_0201498986 /NCGR_PEP_ID=MMETSP0151_2-20130828/73951_1 /ASSEMBLY_ACC=CAM_ASM_000257 /TAXON_ID=200890 /ORGANISM="Paramoeba atlantica, Strain 621/1 / CCAP 1560/9" /LENGTH=84 /DNA_ID=CAMNT_0047890967 /DNA_START=1 /DNA_END=255 /DNA_ORIENTATION=-